MSAPTLDRSEILAEVSAALAAGLSVDTAELAARYGRSDRWARRIKADARERLTKRPNSGADTAERLDMAADAEADTALVRADVEERTADTALVRADVEERTADTALVRSDVEERTADTAEAVSAGREAVRAVSADTEADTALVRADVEAVRSDVRSVRETAEAVRADVEERTADTEWPSGGHGVAWSVFLGGILVSVVFNVLAVADGPLAAKILAPVWPLALLGSVELATRAVWPSGGWWVFVRITATATVAFASAWISFGHIAGVVASWGADSTSAALAPVAIDGAMLLAGAVLAVGDRRGE